MKVLLISTNRHPLPVPVVPLGACIVAAAAANAGHSVEVLDLMFSRDPMRSAERAITAARPDLIGLSIRNIDNNDMRNPLFFLQDILPLVDTIKKYSDAPIVVGGAAAGVMPDEIFRFLKADILVTGDGESVFPALLERISRALPLSDIPGILYREGGETRKNSPHNFGSTSCQGPDFFRWIDAKKYRSGLATAPLQTKLGCHFNCIYCTYRKIEGSQYRFFETEQVFDAARRLISSGLRDIEFVDNVFNFPYDHAVRICDGLAAKATGGRFYTVEINPGFMDQSLARLMASAGFRGIGITAESASGKVLEKLRKGYSPDDVARAAECVIKGNLPCFWMFLLGGPGETEATVRETLCFARKFIRHHDTVFFNVGVRIYPGTGLELLAREEGSLELCRGEMLSPVFYLSPEIDREWLISQIKNAMNSHPNFIDSGSIGLSYLPLLHRLAYKAGVRSQLWKYTPLIRRGLKLLGADV